MKKLILFLILGIFLFSFISASECPLATPRYGVVQCVNTGQEETQSSSFGTFDGEWSLNEINCLSNCVIYSDEDILTECNDLYDWSKIEIYKNGAKKENYPINWNEGDELMVKGRCQTLFNKYPLPSEAKVFYEQDKIILKEGWAGSLPDTPIIGSKDCILNKNYETIDSYFDPTSNSQEDSPESSYTNLNDFPDSWKIDDHFIFVKDWETGIAGISLTYDKENNAYWCGGNYGNRKIYAVEEVESNGNCYSIPKSISKSNLECCFPSDCESLGNQYTCNPETWSCEETKPCNSQIECESTFGEGICESGEIVSWTCNTNKKWGDYIGTCEQESRLVEECSSDCSSKEYYNEEQGKCLIRANIEYSEKQKEEEREASLTETDSSPDLDSQLSSSKQSSSTGKIILIIFLIIILGSIAFFIYVKTKNKKKPIKTKEKAEKKQSKKEILRNGFCGKCGAPLKKGSLFCSKCGVKVKKKH